MKLNILPEIREALVGGSAPVVALESTLLAHGLPAPKNLEVAQDLENTVREQGAIPATIAIIDGDFCVGLDHLQLKQICEQPVSKASIRDLAVAVSQGGLWATTVASTMHIAAEARIRVFATGGIGGVHRGAGQTYDESADLMALQRYPVAVVSAGAKAILDLAATYERLETLGVPVLGFNTEYFPAFYSASDKIKLAHTFSAAKDIAAVMTQQFDELGLGGILVVQDPPIEFAQDPVHVEQLIESALLCAQAEGLCGPAITPYLLSALNEASSGDVVQTNIALVKNNASLAAKLAVEYARKN